MEKKSRSELIRIIEQQSEKLIRYETKLRDVVSAYKNLHKEKEALEASIKVFTSTQETLPKPSTKANKKRTDEIPADGGSHDKKSNETPVSFPLTEERQEKVNDKNKLVSVDDCDHPLGKTVEDESGGSNKEEESVSLVDEKDIHVDDDDDDDNDDTDELNSFKKKVATLSSTLQTVMEQKAIMETNYQVDKKKMMQEFGAKQDELLHENEGVKSKLSEVEDHLKETKKRMRQEQQSREEEENNNILMLRELQVLLSKERMAKEELEQQLDETKERLTNSKTIPETKALEYEHRIQSLKEELEDIRSRLRRAEETAAKPSPLLLRLKEEMEEMKKENTEALLREEKRANEAEEKLEIITNVEESRVSDLENKLSELSEVVGSYEKLKFQDQLVIQKLKERLQQLDVENTALAQHSPTAEIPDNNRQTVSEMESLREQVYKLRTALKYALENSSFPKEGDFEGLSKSELDSILNSDPTHKICQQELKQLKDEFELYKAKTNPVLKSKSFKDLASQLENFEKIKSRNTKLEKRIIELQESVKKKETEKNITISDLKSELQNVEESLTSEKEECEMFYKQKLAELEKQVLKLRERTLDLVAEKDAEIDSLRTRSPSASPSGVRTGYFAYPRRYMDPNLMKLSEGLELDENDRGEETNEAVRQLITRQAGVSSGEGALIHYAQQQARREAENAALRRQKIELEDELRDMSLREAKQGDQCKTLKEEIRKLERDRSRESANLEYVKNVVLRFMLSTSYSVKEQMIVAIATVLQFSPKELEKVRKAHVGGWWGSAS